MTTTSNRLPDPVRVRLGWVSSVETDPEGDVRLALDDGTRCVLDQDSGWFDLWSRLVAESLEYGWPVYVGLERESGRVRLLLHAKVHRVEGVRADPQDAGRLRVRLSDSNAIHALRMDGPGREQMASCLREAAGTGRPVVITEDPLGTEIIDVRFAPQTAPAPS